MKNAILIYKINADLIQIENVAKMINTYEDSIAPHQDCCAFFTPIHPELKGHVKKIEYIESTLDTDSLYKEIIDKREVYKT